MKKFIDCYIPVTTCNLRCHYCYITQGRKFNNSLPKFKYDAYYIRNALSVNRLGGVCHLNLCGGGETLLPPEVPKIIKELLEEGHYLMVVTNGTITKRIDELMCFPDALLRRLCFKISFHYLELKRLGKLEDFFANIEKIKKSSASLTLEITPNDELIPYIEEVRNIAQKYLKTDCHVTVARNDIDERRPVLTKYKIDEYKKTWSVFSSNLFDFKLPLFYKKRNEFCYAGTWSALVDIGTGDLKQCYGYEPIDNIYSDLSKPLNFLAVGYGCKMPHCYNAHSFLALGVIPEMETPCYLELRNRMCDDGSEWIKPVVKEFFSRKLKNFNYQYSDKEKQIISKKNKYIKLKNKIKRIYNVLKNK